MAEYNNLASLFSDIATAIRTKTGSEGLIVATDFPTEIGNISTTNFIFEDNATISGTQRSFERCVYNGSASSNQNYVTYSTSDFYTKYIIFLKASTSGAGPSMSGYIDFRNDTIVQTENTAYWTGDETSGWYITSDVDSQKGLKPNTTCYIPTSVHANTKFIYIAVG